MAKLFTGRWASWIMTAMGRPSKAEMRCGSPSRRPTGPVLTVRMTFRCASGEVKRGGGMGGGAVRGMMVEMTGVRVEVEVEMEVEVEVVQVD